MTGLDKPLGAPTALRWDGNPYEAGPADDAGFHVEPHRVLAVLCGQARMADVELTDPRLRAIAAVGESFRECHVAPTPERIAIMLDRILGPQRGVLPWVRALLSDRAAGEAEARRKGSR